MHADILLKFKKNNMLLYSFEENNDKVSIFGLYTPIIFEK